MEPPIPLDHDIIEQLARAIIGQLAPLTGTRAAGAITLANDGDDDIEVPKNMYLLPVVGSDQGAGKGELRHDLVFKTSPNPDTLGAHGVDGSWIVPAHGELEVAIQSNIGGAQNNLPVGTEFQWDPPLEFFPVRATLTTASTGGLPPPDGSRVPVQRIVYFEELNAAAIERDIEAARLILPGILLIWESSTPGEGRTAGTNQGSTRLADGYRLFMEAFRLFVVVGQHNSDAQRRAQGLRILQAASRLLSDQQTTSDFERLSSNGSLEITGRNRFARDERHYVYSIAFRVQRVYSRAEFRTFVPWLKTHLVTALPGREDPEPTEPLVMVDTVEPNPPGTL